MVLAKVAALVSGVAALRPGRGTRRPPVGAGRLLLHVGTHKTGTTSIQQALHEGSRELSSQGVVFPNAAWSFGGDPRRSTGAAHFAFAQALADPLERSRPRLEAFRDRLAAALAASRTVVISAESLYRHVLLAPGSKPNEEQRRAAREAYVRRLAEFLDGFDPEVVIYFRRPDAFAESLYQEAAARGLATGPFHRFLSRDAFRFEYGFQLELLRRHFPVHAFGFEAAASEGLVEHFLGIVGARIEGRPKEPVLRASVPKPAAQWLVRHGAAARSSGAARRLHWRRWLFALQAGHRDLFAAPAGAGFWRSDKQRDSFMRRAVAGFDLVDFPPPPPVITLPNWTDEQDRRTEEAFAAWKARHWVRLLQRDLGHVPPYVAPEIG